MRAELRALRLRGRPRLHWRDGDVARRTKIAARQGGRPPQFTADQVKAARRMYGQQDMTAAQIGQVLGVSRTTICRTLNRQPEPAVPRRAAKMVPAGSITSFSAESA